MVLGFNRPYAHPTSSFNQPVNPPSSDPDAGDLVSVCFSFEWLPYVLGALSQLQLQSTWKSDDPMVVRLAQQRATNLINMFARGTCEQESEPPYWEDADNVDDHDDDGIPWYDQLGDWFLTGFLAVTVSPQAGIFYKTFVPRARVAFQRGEWGAFFKIFLDGLEMYTGDSYAPIKDILEVDLDFEAFASANGLGSAPYDLRIEHAGYANPLATPTPSGYQLAVVRKKLDEDELNAITDIQQVSGQLQIQRGNIPTWINVLNADNVRRDGSTIITGQQQWRTGTALPALIRLNPNAGESAIRVQLPVTSTVDVLGVLNSAGQTIFKIDSAGRFQGRGSDNSQFAFLNASGSLMVGFSTVGGSSPILSLTQVSGGTGNFLNALSPTGVLYAAISVSGALRGRGGLTLYGASSIQEREQAALTAVFNSGVDATRTAQFVLSAYDWTGAREVIRGGANGSASTLGFYGATPVIKPTVTGDRMGNAALASALTALQSLGLIVNSTTAGSALPVPFTVTGERDDNRALASLLEGMEANGYIIDSTTIGSTPLFNITLLTACSVAYGLRDVLLGDLVLLLTTAVNSWAINPANSISQIVGDYVELRDGTWINSDDIQPLNDWLETVTTGAFDREVMAQDLLDWMLDTVNRNEIARVWYCNLDDGCVTGFDEQDLLASSLREEHAGNANFEAMALWIDSISLPRVQYAALYGGLCNYGADCSALQCATTSTPVTMTPLSYADAVYTTPFSTVTGTPYQVRIEGTWWEGTSPRYDFDPCYDSTNSWVAHTANAGIFDIFKINGVARGGDSAYSSSHIYTFTITGDGNPIVVRKTFLFGNVGGSWTVTITGIGA